MEEKIFKRIEQKYLIEEAIYYKIIKTIKEYMAKDKYYKSSIYNIYFDNNNEDLIIKSLEKPKYKYKIRCRTYSIKDNKIYFEIKSKFKGIVYKRRLLLTTDEYYNYMQNNIFPDHDFQIMKEIDYLIKYHKLEPKIFIAYDRYSYRDLKSDLRITFDYNLRSRKNNLEIKTDEENTNYFTNNSYIMEIKATNNYPLWFSKLLAKYKIYPTSFSKYGKIYTKNKEMKEC